MTHILQSLPAGQRVGIAFSGGLHRKQALLQLEGVLLL